MIICIKKVINLSEKSRLPVIQSCILQSRGVLAEMGTKSLNSRQLVQRQRWDPTPFTPFWYSFPLQLLSRDAFTCTAPRGLRGQRTHVLCLFSRRRRLLLGRLASRQSSLCCDGLQSIESRDSAHARPTASNVKYSSQRPPRLGQYPNVWYLVIVHAKFCDKRYYRLPWGFCRWVSCFSLWILTAHQLVEKFWRCSSNCLICDIATSVADDGKYHNIQ